MQNKQRHYSHNERRFDRNDRSEDSRNPEREEKTEQPGKVKNEIVKAQSCTYGTTHLFGFIYNLALLYLVYYFVNNGERSLALIIFSVNALIIILALLSKVNERRKRHHNPHRRNRGGNNRFRGN